MQAVVLFLFFLCLPLFGAQDTAPEARQPGVDIELVGDEPRTFFEQRNQDKACVADLNKHTAAYKSLRSKIEKLKATRDPASTQDAKYKATNDEIDALEKGVALERLQVLALLPKCGKCAARPIEGIQVKGRTRTNNWYVSDASCQIDETDPQKLQAAFEVVRDSLLHAKRYPRHLNGFDSVIDFQLVDSEPATGPQGGNKYTFRPDLNEFPADEFNLAIWVKGPNLGFPTAFHYLMDGWIEEKTDPALSEFALRFKTTDPATSQKVTFPPMLLLGASGRGSTIRVNTRLHHVEGWWYVNSQGYTRYFIQAQLNLPENLVQAMGMNVLMATVLELSDRGEEIE